MIGTLSQGFKYYLLLQPGLERALFMQYIVSEVHPFNDGNGRLSRIMMNAELVCTDQFKVIIPTVHRENYLNGLRMASRTQNFRLFCKAIDQAQAYTASVNWQDYADARSKIEEDSADTEPDDGIPIFNRAIRQLKLSDLGSD